MHTETHKILPLFCIPIQFCAPVSEFVILKHYIKLGNNKVHRTIFICELIQNKYRICCRVIRFLNKKENYFRSIYSVLDN